MAGAFRSLGRGIGLIGGLMSRNNVGWLDFNGVPVDGSSGTYAGVAGPGSVVRDYNTGIEYVNVGTKASPIWLGNGSTITALSSVDLLALSVTPKTIVAAPGAGKVAVLDALIFSFTHLVSYANGGIITAQYHGASTNLMSSSVPASVLTGSADVIAMFGPAQTASGVIGVANAAIELTNATAPFITGTGTAKVWARWRSVKL